MLLSKNEFLYTIFVVLEDDRILYKKGRFDNKFANFNFFLRVFAELISKRLKREIQQERISRMIESLPLWSLPDAFIGA